MALINIWFGHLCHLTVKLLRGLTCLAAVLYSLHVSAGHQTLHNWCHSFVLAVGAVIAGKNCSVLALSSVGEAAYSEICAKTFRVMHSPIVNSLLKVQVKINKLSSIFTQLPSFSSPFTNHGLLWCCTSFVFSCDSEAADVDS